MAASKFVVTVSGVKAFKATCTIKEKEKKSNLLK